MGVKWRAMIFERLATWWQRLRNRPKNPTLGQQGEAAAARFLRKQGLKIVERNWTCPGGEVDVIAREKAVLVFIEVKTRRGGPVTPQEQVNPDKERRVSRAADFYLRRWPEEEWPLVRFDIVAVSWPDDDEPQIEWLRDAFV
ncbi:MAG: YraN family protein [Planctomycetota bacterium]